MDRSREVNKRASMAVPNGLARRRQKSSSLRDSPEDDGVGDLQEPVRLRDRVSLKKDRDRDREHRERERERDRDRDRSTRNKRRRRDRLMHHREGGGDESSEESVNDEEEVEEDDDGGGSTPLRMFPPNPVSSLSTMSNHSHRKSFIPPVKVYKSPPTWKTADEMIGVSVPRKTRTASTKRSHECWMLSGNGSAGVGEQFHQQTSTSPTRTNLVHAVSSPTPISPPSSSNASGRKKMKCNSSKQRPPKTPSLNQEEIEFEIAEVLYGLRQNQGTSRVDVGDSVKFNSRETIKSSGDVKTGVSSPFSNMNSSQSQNRPQASSSSLATHFSATAPKRKKPRPVRYEEEISGALNLSNCPISSSVKAEINQPPKTEFASRNEDKVSGSVFENVGSNLSESKPSIEVVENKDPVLALDAPCSANEPCDLKLGANSLDSVTTIQTNLTIPVAENHREEKFQIDLMAPPPQLKTSPEREKEFDFISVVPKSSSNVKTENKENENGPTLGKVEVPGEPGSTKVKAVVEEHKCVVSRDINVDLRLDLEKHNDDSRHFQHVPKQQMKQQQSKPCRDDLNNTDNTAQPNSSLSLPMSVSWSGGVSQMGFMRPLQGVVSLDGAASTVHSLPAQPPHPIFSQPRPKRCATHCYIARNICYYQHYARMNSFWPAAAAAVSNTAAASLHGKPCNLNLMAAAPELQASIPPLKNMSSLQDINSSKGPNLSTFIGQSGKDKASQVSSVADAVQKKQQILLPQTLSPGASTNIMHAPAFIFPLNQQQSVSSQSGAVKSSSILPGSSASSSLNSAPSAAAAMSFSYPNMPTSETPYLAILQNNGYPFPIPTPGAPPSFFNSSFYSSQMIHPSQLQQHVVTTSSQQPVHPNRSVSAGGSSVSQKNVQNQQLRNSSSGGINLQGYPATQKHHPYNHAQRQVQTMQHNISSLQQHHQGVDMGGGEDGNNNNPSSADSRVAVRATSANINVYGQNFAMPIHPVNFALMTSSVSSMDENGQKQPHPQLQQQKSLMKSGGGEPLASSQAFAMTFASINGGGGTSGGASAAPGFDVSSMTQNHAAILPEHARHNYQVMAKSYQGKSESSRVDEGRKAIMEKASNSQENNSTLMGSSVLPSCATAPSVSHSNNNSQLQQRHQQQQLLQVQKQHQQQHLLPSSAAAPSRGKTTCNNNGGVFSESSIAAKFPNVFPNLVQGNCSSSSNPSQSSPQWKSASLRTSSSSQMTPSSSSTKSVPQYNSVPPHPQHHQGPKPQQSHLQISFGANHPSKPPSSLSQSPPRMMVGSPTTSSISRNSGGSPRTAPKPTHQASTLSSSSQGKNSPSSMKSPPLGGGVRNVCPIMTSSSMKMQVSQQHQQPISKQALQQQTQLFFSSPYVQQQPQQQTQTLPDSSSVTMNPPTPSSSMANRFYNTTSNNNQRRRSGPGPPSSQQAPMPHRSLPMGAPTISKTNNTDLTSRASSAAVNVKVGGGIPNSHQIVAAGFPYVQSTMPSSQAVHQLKQVEQKQGATAAPSPSLPPSS